MISLRIYFLNPSEFNSKNPINLKKLLKKDPINIMRNLWKNPQNPLINKPNFNLILNGTILNKPINQKTIIPIQNLKTLFKKDTT